MYINKIILAHICICLFRKKALESKVMNSNFSAAATIASEDEDYKHMGDVEEEDERVEPMRRRYVDKPVQKQRSRPRKAAWTEQRDEERIRCSNFNVKFCSIIYTHTGISMSYLAEY